MANFFITVADNGYIVENAGTNCVSVYEGEDISKEMYEELLIERLTTTLLSLRAKGPSALPIKVKFEINVNYQVV